ncbi:hypothetical protein PFISCL1PPCAC_6451, partial [Pristionchus fissidentatus]
MKGTSDNRWARRSGERSKRWDYGYVYVPAIVGGTLVSIAIWYLNWDSHQTEYTSLGVVNDDLGMMGWMSMAYSFCALYSFAKAFDIIMDRQRR